MSTLSGLFPSSGIVLIDEQIITVSGNWLKAAGVKPTDRAIVEMWSGGGSGARTGSSGLCFGGQGGHHLQLEFFAFELPSSVACVIGAGGAARSTDQDGGPGGASSFGNIVLPGGKGGKYANNSLNQASVLLPPTELSSFSVAMVTNDQLALSVANPNLPIETGGLSYSSGGGSFVSAISRRMAGGGGGTCVSNTIFPPGNSFLGGVGGIAAYGNGNNAANGSIPGGGGGGKDTAGSGNGNSGAGARGEIRVRVLRGAS